jgi:hypothetical protein
MATKMLREVQEDQLDDDRDSSTGNGILGGRRICKDTLRDLFSSGIINKTAYIALVFVLEQPTDGNEQEIDPIEFAESLGFDRVGPNNKDKTYDFSPAEVEAAIAKLNSKGLLHAQKPPVQITINLKY